MSGGVRDAEVGELLALIVHDLRNPGATLAANVAYLRDIGVTGPPSSIDEVGEALVDMDSAMSDLMRGLEHVAWIARWMSGEPALTPTDGDVIAGMASAVRSMRLEASISGEPGPLRAAGGASVRRLVEVLLANSERHGRGRIALSARRDGAEVIVEIEDGGRALAEDLRATAFTLPGQRDLKGRADGRYGRVAGLFTAGVLAEGIGATLEADGEDGAAVFRIRLPAL